MARRSPSRASSEDARTGAGHALDSMMYRDMFGSAAIRGVFADVALVQYWLDVEAALAHAEAEVGLIPLEAADSIQAVCSLSHLDLDELKAGTELVGYPILPLVRQIAHAVGDGASGYVHWGATTQDIMDTATALQVRDTRRLVEGDLKHVIERLQDLAGTHRDT